MNRLQEEVASYTANEGMRRQFMNLYRLVKTASLLISLFLSDSISRQVCRAEAKETLEKIDMLKKQLEKYDIRRFCQLWGIETQFNNLGKLIEFIKNDDLTVTIGVARVANLLPQINEDAYAASTYGDIHQSLSRFCLELIRMKEAEKGMPASLKKILDDIVALELAFSQKYQRLSDPLDESSKDLLKEQLTKFRVEYQRAYHF